MNIYFDHFPSKRTILASVFPSSINKRFFIAMDCGVSKRVFFRATRTISVSFYFRKIDNSNNTPICWRNNTQKLPSCFQRNLQPLHLQEHSRSMIRYKTVRT